LWTISFWYTQVYKPNLRDFFERETSSKKHSEWYDCNIFEEGWRNRCPFFGSSHMPWAKISRCATATANGWTKDDDLLFFTCQIKNVVISRYAWSFMICFKRLTHLSHFTHWIKTEKSKVLPVSPVCKGDQVCSGLFGLRGKVKQNLEHYLGCEN